MNPPATTTGQYGALAFVRSINIVNWIELPAIAVLPMHFHAYSIAWPPSLSAAAS
jgi:hypothetical protein